ncbi:MAG: hypothetical protein ACI92Z_002645, partial [Paracoccaceae bacterium]
SFIRILFGLTVLGLTLSGCATGTPNADPATIAAVSYRDPGPKSMTLYTMVNNRSGSGAHSGLVIASSETILFDPAGSFYLDGIPERDDVLYGINPGIEWAYKSAHARTSHHVVVQTVPLTPQQAAVAYQLAVQNGSVGSAFCSNATSSLISKIPGFENIKTTLSPKNLSKQFGALPGVKTERYFEDDSPDLEAALAAGYKAPVSTE